MIAHRILFVCGCLAFVETLPAAVVSERWGSEGHVQHKAVVYRTVDAGTLIEIDLKDLPGNTSIYRARLVVTRRQTGNYGPGYSVIPVDDDKSLQAAGEPLVLIGPLFRWFDATAVVDRWRKEKRPTGRLLLKGPAIDLARSHLEIAFEGPLTDKPPQVKDVKAFYRSGQIFITFREIEDLSEGQDDYSWGQLIKKSRGYSTEMLVPNDDRREVRYRVYRHGEPITPANIGRARLLADVVPGSRFNTRQVKRIFMGEQTPSKLDEAFIAVRLAVEPGRPLPSGVGKYVHTIDKPGRGYYAVVAAVNGVENTVDIMAANTAGPVDEAVAVLEPVLNKEVELTVRDKKGRYTQRWYNWYVGPPLSSLPICYDVVVGFAPEHLKTPASLYFHRGHSWIDEAEPAEPNLSGRIDVAHCGDHPNAFWMGINDAYSTLKGPDEGRWQPFPQRRQEVLIEWVDRQWGIDRQRVSVGVGAWGMMEIERPEVYAYLHGWGLPEISKGFQAWQRANAVWGGPAVYAARPNAESPYWRQDFSSYVLEDPRKETPLFIMHTGWGAQFTEMGWPPLPRFWRAMTAARRPFFYNWRVKPEERPDVRRDGSLPAFGNCTLDDNPGNGDLFNGETFDAQLNGYLNWDGETVDDEPRRWAATVWLDRAAPLAQCTVDITPRRCQNFRPRPNDRFAWINRVGDSELGRGVAVADQHGLVTLPQVNVGKQRNRIEIRASKQNLAETDR